MGCDPYPNIRKNQSLLPDNTFRYTFPITEIFAEGRDRSTKVYSPSNPNSMQVNRLLLESIADKNSVATISLIMSPIEMEHQQLANSFKKVCIGNRHHQQRHANTQCVARQPFPSVTPFYVGPMAVIC